MSLLHKTTMERWEIANVLGLPPCDLEWAYVPPGRAAIALWPFCTWCTTHHALPVYVNNRCHWTFCQDVHAWGTNGVFVVVLGGGTFIEYAPSFNACNCINLARTLLSDLGWIASSCGMRWLGIERILKNSDISCRGNNLGILGINFATFIGSNSVVVLQMSHRCKSIKSNILSGSCHVSLDTDEHNLPWMMVNQWLIWATTVLFLCRISKLTYRWEKRKTSARMKYLSW